MTWVSGETLIADLYPSEEQGAPLSFATSGVGIGLLIGPFIGGSFYEIRKQKSDPFWFAFSLISH